MELLDNNGELVAKIEEFFKEQYIPMYMEGYRYLLLVALYKITVNKQASVVDACRFVAEKENVRVDSVKARLQQLFVEANIQRKEHGLQTQTAKPFLTVCANHFINYKNQMN